MKCIRIFLLSVAICGSVSSIAQGTDPVMQQIREMDKLDDPAQSTRMMKEIIKKFDLREDKDAETMDMLKGIVALDYLEMDKYNEFDKMILSIRNKFNQTSYMNMGTMALLKKKNNKKAEELGKRTLDLYFSYKDDPDARPKDYPEKDWKWFTSFAYYPYCDAYAEALAAVGKNKEALLYQEKAFNGPVEEGLPPSVERYANLLLLNNQEEKAYSLVLKLAETGKSTPVTDKILKELYVKKNKDGAGFDAFFAGLQKNVVASLKKKYEKEMLNAEAPGFTLKDLEGKTVSLSDYRGKVVVLDFWATWCGPCIASFPAMTKLMQQHPEVVFLYIATREKPDGALERVKGFIAQHQYPFHVLMDEPLKDNPSEYEVVAAYKPNGIPAKIVIDATGKQRFLTIGYTSENDLMNEMEAMIQLAAEQR